MLNIPWMLNIPKLIEFGFEFELNFLRVNSYSPNSVWLVVCSSEFSVWFMVFGLLLMPIHYLPNSLL